MPKPKESAGNNVGRINQMDAYTYDEYKRANIPPVGMAQYDTVASPEAKYEYDPHIDPSLQWAGKKEGWYKLAKVLKAEINQDLIEKYHGVESLPFAVKDNTLIAVKIVDDRGIESLKIIPAGEK
jgi:hypothetical protein